jgi:actin-like ATPase involved in cell morphogenesis
VVVDGYRLSVDFGTSHTVAMLMDPGGRARPLLFGSSPLMSSAVFAKGGGGLLVGAEAERALLADPAGLEPHPKRRIDEETVWLGGREIEVVDLLAAVVGRVVEEAARVAGGMPADVVLTHPATWGATRIRRLAVAAGRAGLEGLRFMAEPVAAAVYFAAVRGRQVTRGSSIVVYDLGAGTFDVSVLRATADGFEVAASQGLDDFGGLDLDAVVVDCAREAVADAGVWARLDRPATGADQRARFELWREARAAKEHLSRHTIADLTVPLAHTAVHITREQFEAAARPHLERTVAQTRDLLRRASIAPAFVDEVYLVGGASRIPLAATLLHRGLGIAPTVLDQPELVVAEGALQHLASRSTVARPAAASREPLTRRPPPVPPAPVRAPARPRGWLVQLASAHPVGAAAVALAAVAAAVLPPVLLADSSPGPAKPTASSASVSAVQAERLGPAVLADAGEDYVRGVTFSPDDRTLASVADDGTLRLWDARTRFPLGAAMTGHTRWVHSVQYSFDGKLLVTASSDRTVRLWDAVARRPHGRPLTGHTDLVFGAVFNKDATVVASVSDDMTVRLWDVATARPLGPPLTGHTGWVRGVAFSPDGTVLATASHDRMVQLWSVAERKPLGEPLAGHLDAVGAVAFSPDGRLLASGAGDNTIRLWDVQTRRPLGDPIPFGAAWVNSVAFSPDGTILAVAGGQANVQLWHVASRQLAGEVATEHGTSVEGLAFSRDGTLLATAGERGAMQVWQLRR